LEQWDEIVPAEERTVCAQRYAELVEGQRDQDEYEQHFIRRDGHLGTSGYETSSAVGQCLMPVRSAKDSQ
jgi:hypothetical protein